ncbi:MAG TPA: TIGR03560 family F420-dependent LLM class oxidoreductase [Levilinea sp.]|nr:TIGR03560 family F420-dependent LLM class oxidoreductase [Levilinea sp.]
MRFGLQLVPNPVEPGINEFDRMRDAAQLAEELGYDSVWYEDHFMFPLERPYQPVQLECLAAVAALAASTHRIRLGMLVLGVPYRNPALLAKMLTTIDVISHGRVIVGLGAGWHELEFEAYGWPFPTLNERFDRLEEAVQVIDRMMTQTPASFEGKYYQVKDALNLPMPVQKPRPPILIGGNGEKRTLRAVAKYGDMCNVIVDAEQARHKFEVLRQHCSEVGRPYEQITRSVNYWTVFGRTDAERAAKKERFPRGVEDLAGIAEKMKAYQAAGTQVIITRIFDGNDLEPIRQFAEAVFPAFQ